MLALDLIRGASFCPDGLKQYSFALDISMHLSVQNDLYTPMPVCGKFHVTMSVPACGNLIPFLTAGLQGLSCPALQFNCPLFGQL